MADYFTPHSVLFWKIIWQRSARNHRPTQRWRFVYSCVQIFFIFCSVFHWEIKTTLNFYDFYNNDKIYNKRLIRCLFKQIKQQRLPFHLHRHFHLELQKTKCGPQTQTDQSSVSRLMVYSRWSIWNEKVLNWAKAKMKKTYWLHLTTYE